MSSDEVVQGVVTSDVLMPEEVVFVLKHLAKPESDTASSSIVGNSFRINPSRESRASRITKVRKEQTMYMCMPGSLTPERE